MATVQGKIYSALGVPVQTAVEFETISAPVLGTDYVVSKTRKTQSTDAEGLFEITLEAGDYYARWTVGTVVTQVRFAVPDSLLTYQLRNLISDAVSYPYAVNPQYVLTAPPHGSFRIKDGQHIQLWNPSTQLWHTLVASGPDGALQVGLSEGMA